MDVVQQNYREGEMSDRRHVVADRDWFNYDHADSWRNPDKAGNRDASFLRYSSRCCQQGRKIRSGESRGVSCHKKAVAINDAGCVSRSGEIQENLLERY